MTLLYENGRRFKFVSDDAEAVKLDGLRSVHTKLPQATHILGREHPVHNAIEIWKCYSMHRTMLANDI